MLKSASLATCCALAATLNAPLLHAEETDGPETVIYQFDDSLATSSEKEEAPEEEEPTQLVRNHSGLKISTQPKVVLEDEPDDPGTRFIRSLATRPSEPLSITPPQEKKGPSNFPWKKNIVTTTFWIGQGASGYNSTMNKASAWDMNWRGNYGGEDRRDKRDAGILPATFAAKRNPFYIALPFNDVKYPKIAAKWIPWWDPKKAKEDRWKSQVQGRWVKIRAMDGRLCYAQWEDVGPFRYDHAEYIWGNERPTTYNKAGLDVSPAVENYLGLDGLDLCDWRFVEAHEVPEGPWLKYGEQAIIYSALERVRAKEKAEARKQK
ncbi:MAG: hypothetical protein AAGK14_10035 [Verrucomicrobiota bacterium]